MMSLSEIERLNRIATIRACREQKKPFPVEECDVGRVEALRGIPYVGYACPEGYERVNLTELGDTRKRGVYMGDALGYGAYFVDKTGWGAKNEPALTVQEFADMLRPGYSYGIVEDGPFQVKIGVFRRKSAKAA